MESIDDEKKLLESIAQGITALFGENCEAVIHDLKGMPYEHSIVSIYNGQVTGRKAGDCGTNLGLEVIRGKIVDGDRYNYVAQSPSGRILRSSTMYLRNSSNDVIGAFCINFDVTDIIMAQKTLETVASGDTRGRTSEQAPDTEEIFCSDVNALLEELIQQSIEFVGKPVAAMSKDDKIKGLKFLDKKGAFLIKKAGDRIAKFYDISKYTIYSYLECEEK